MSFGTPQELNLGVGNISSQIQVITAIQNDNDIPLKISLYEIKDKTKTNIPVPQTGYSIRLDTVNPNGVSKPLTCAINDDGTIETSLPNTVLSVIGCVECQLNQGF
jgi:hypothetical protein